MMTGRPDPEMALNRKSICAAPATSQCPTGIALVTFPASCSMRSSIRTFSLGLSAPILEPMTDRCHQLAQPAVRRLIFEAAVPQHRNRHRRRGAGQLADLQLVGWRIRLGD